MAITGIGLSAAAGFYTYSLSHEQQESLGAAVVDYLATSKCTTIRSTLASLSIARSDVLNGEPEDTHTSPQNTQAIGVVNPLNWQLEELHGSGISAPEAQRALQSLPPEAWQNASTTKAINSEERRALDPYTCSMGYGVKPEAVRIYAIANPAGGPSATLAGGTQSSSDRSDTWLTLLYGPWEHQGQRKTAFALINLNSATLQGSSPNSDLASLFPNNTGRLEMKVDLLSPATTAQDLTEHGKSGALDDSDHKLLGLRIIPFANQILRGELSIDHQQLNRLPTTSGLLVFLMGLLATAGVSVISRRSELNQLKLNRALRHESHTDGLTNLGNRRRWDAAIHQAEAQWKRDGRPYGLIVIDLDGFKEINDNQGHAMGDQVLKKAADAMKELVRTSDLVARVGGDEFAILSFNPSSEGLSLLADRLSQALSDTGIQASVGFAMTQQGVTLEETWAAADRAMYGRKGRRRSMIATPQDEEPPAMPQPAIPPAD